MAIHRKVEQESHSGWCRQRDQRCSECWAFICQARAKERYIHCCSVRILWLFCLSGLVVQLLCATFLSPYASGAFFCHQRLLFSTLHCRDITVCIARGWASSKTLHCTCTALAYHFFKTHVYLPIINCVPNVTFARPSSCVWHKHRGGSSSTDYWWPYSYQHSNDSARDLKFMCNLECETYTTVHALQ